MNRKLWAKIKKKKRYWERLKKMQGDGVNKSNEYIQVQENYLRLSNQV